MPHLFTTWYFFPAILALAGVLLASSHIQAADNTYAAALADLRRAQADTEVLGTTIENAVEMRAKFFGRVAVESLGPREIAELVRLYAFRYSETGSSKAKIAAAQLKAPSAAPDLDGALAATLRVLLSSEAGIKGNDRTEVIHAALHHPAYVSLLRGDYGDLALSAACRAGMRSENFREYVMSLAGKLDASQSCSAADSTREYWSKIEQAVPEGEQRQQLRQHLADYLTAVLAKYGADLSEQHRTKIENSLAQLNSIPARGGKLAGQPAPELHFLWSSDANWKSLSDLRGKVVVLDFWATWCGACIESFPKVAKLNERYRNADVIVLGVTSLQGAVHGLGKTIDCRGDPEKELRLMTDYIKAKNITWPVVYSRENVFNPAYAINGIPHAVVIAPDGIVRYQGSPEETPLTEQIDALLHEFELKPPATKS